MGLFEYLFMFWLEKHLPAKQALNSKDSAKGYGRILPEILRRSDFPEFCIFLDFSDHTGGALLYYSPLTIFLLAFGQGLT